MIESIRITGQLQSEPSWASRSERSNKFRIISGTEWKKLQVKMWLKDAKIFFSATRPITAEYVRVQEDGFNWRGKEVKPIRGWAYQNDVRGQNDEVSLDKNTGVLHLRGPKVKEFYDYMDAPYGRKRHNCAIGLFIDRGLYWIYPQKGSVWEGSYQATANQKVYAND